MVVSLKHSKTSAKTDSADATLVQPSDWNAEHTLTAAQDTVLGRVSAGTGAIEEITVTAAGRALLDDADAAAQRATLAVAGTAVSNTFTATQIMSGNGSTTAPINLSVSYAPSAPANGDIWFNNNRLTYRQASTSYTVPRNDAVTTWSAVQTFTASPVINVTDNTNAALRITQAGTGNALLVEDSANPDATPTVIDASGRVVVGHTAALSAGGTIAPFQVVGTTNATAMIQSYRYSADTSPPFVTFAKSRAATIGGSGALLSGDDLGNFVWRGDDGTNFVAGALLGAELDAAPTTGNMPTALLFSTSVSAGNVIERMRIGSSGALGFGGANYGTSGQVLVSGGPSSSPSWASATVTPNVQTFFASGTWTKPTGNYNWVRVQIWGGGGSGGRGISAQASGGGGGGSYNEYTFPYSSVSTDSITIGAGGAVPTGTFPRAGLVGGATSFGTLLYAYGGGGGGRQPADGGGQGGGPFKAGVSSSNSNVTNGGGADGGIGSDTLDASSVGVPYNPFGGGGGGGASPTATTTAAAGGVALFGGAGGGGGNEDSSPGPGAGGISTFGGNGGAGAFDANTATSGSVPGGGGGGSETGISGTGGGGKAIVTTY